VHPLPSHLAYQLCQARRADLDRRHRLASVSGAGRSRRSRATRSVRRSTGWFLVELGLRLATPHSPVSATR
jgi:hypothetical protein